MQQAMNKYSLSLILYFHPFNRWQMKTPRSVFILYDKAQLVWGFPLPLIFFLQGQRVGPRIPPGKSTRGRQGSTTGLHQGATESRAPPGRVCTGDLRSRATHEAAEALETLPGSVTRDWRFRENELCHQTENSRGADLGEVSPAWLLG